MSRSKKVHDAPLAVTTDGTILVNLSHSNGPSEPKALLKRALETGAPVFIGTALSATEARVARKWIDDSGAELAATIWGDRPRQRKALKK